MLKTNITWLENKQLSKTGYIVSFDDSEIPTSGLLCLSLLHISEDLKKKISLEEVNLLLDVFSLHLVNDL